MSLPLRPCGRPECKLCGPRDIQRQAWRDEGEEESLAMILLAVGSIIALAVICFVILPAAGVGVP